jgi:antitoxin FitA
MAQLIVRDLEDDVKARPNRRAERHGRSIEEEVRDILRNASKEENRPPPKSRLAYRCASRENRVDNGPAGTARNTRHFADLKVNLIDPWQPPNAR